MRWRNPFRRRARAAASPVAPQEQWRPGDLAECVACAANDWFEVDTGVVCPAGPHRGTTYRVTEVRTDIGCARLTILALSGFEPRTGWDARGFRKVSPGADQLIRAEPEFIALLQHIRRPANLPLIQAHLR